MGNTKRELAENKGRAAQDWRPAGQGPGVCREKAVAKRITRERSRSVIKMSWLMSGTEVPRPGRSSAASGCPGDQAILSGEPLCRAE